MDLLEILDKFEKFENINFEPKNRLRLTDKIAVLLWKRNYWNDYKEGLQNKPYHRRLQKSRKKIDKQNVKENIKRRTKSIKK